MEAEEILSRAQANEGPPRGWVVFPLLRNRVLANMTWWIFGIIFGFATLAFVLPIVIPNNYQHGAAGAIVTTLLLALLLLVAFGSLWAMIVDILRLAQSKQHVIVITYEDFVQQEGKNITHVPLAYVHFVTARGRGPQADIAERRNQEADASDRRETGLFIGRGIIPAPVPGRRRRRRTPTSLAFIDTRTNKEVIVTNDTAYGDPFLIADMLKQYADAAHQIVR